MTKSAYSKNWPKIAYQTKVRDDWKCQYCGLQCFRPGERPVNLSRSEWTRLTLQSHHLDFNCTNDDLNNVISACPSCHLRIHQSRYSSVSPGQLSLFEL